jgi:exopolysaccharide production protein ExoZ
MDSRSPLHVAVGARATALQSVQALRCVAALLVVIFHAGLRFDPTQQTFRIGNAGVDIFFVISGFLMVMVTDRRPTGPVAFLRQRCIRLVPLYWIATMVMVTAAALVPAAFPHTHLTVSHVLLSLAFVPHASPDVDMIIPVLGQGWTLNFEMLFYVLFAGALLLPARRRMTALIAVLVGLTLAGFAVNTQAVPVTTLLSPLLIEFVGGVLLARLIRSGVRLPAMWCWSAVGLGALLLGMAAPAGGDDLARLVQYGVPAMLIVGGLVGCDVGASAAGGLRVGRPLTWLGDASYSIYLTHGFAIAALGKLWPQRMDGWSFIVAATVFAALVGSIVYVLLERPLLAVMREPGRLLRALPAHRAAGLVPGMLSPNS